MNLHHLHQFIATTPGSFGQHFGRRIAVDQIAAGSIDHAAVLVGLAGLGTIPVLIEAGAPPAMLRAAIQYAAINLYRELPPFLARHGGRAAFADWCRQAGFASSATLPETIDLFRGTMGCSPAAASDGLHWSLGFDHAAYYACRFADAALTGVIVVHARVSRDAIAAFITGNAHDEVIPAEAPATFEIITDKERIGDAAVRAALSYQALMSHGWKDNGGEEDTELATLVTRATMAAAGIVPGTAIVA